MKIIPPLQVDFTDKVLLVTGAAGGIGAAVTRRALAAGARVAAFDQAAQKLDAHQNLLRFQGDVTDEAAFIDIVALIRERWKRLDGLVSCAGRVGAGHVEALELVDWNCVLQTNLTGTFLACKHAIPLLRETAGTIINLSSTNGLTGGSALSGLAYAAARAGIIALTKNLARDLAADGIRVNAIAPGPIDTPMLDRLSPEVVTQLRDNIPPGAIGGADDVADLVFFLSSPAARYITGVTVNLSGGMVM
ncbi:MAG: SDR family NAD(P)-dependent oxidoreductase [Blastocatellia bacterium]